MIFPHMLALLCQLFLLYAWWKFSARGTAVVLYKFFNPIGFLSLYYFLYFVVEQIFYPIVGYNILGMENYTQQESIDIFSHTQIVLIVFLASALAGAVLVGQLAQISKSVDVLRVLKSKVDRLDVGVLTLYFAAGMAATVYLGMTFSAISANGSFRSELVKSTPGLIATAISFFGNFAFAALFFILVRRRNYVISALLFLSFSFAILYTGARGRLLWPLLISVCMIISSNNKVPSIRIIFGAIIGLMILSVMDPLRKAITDPTVTFKISQIGDFMWQLLTKRNFDGFANLSLISGSGFIEPKGEYFFSGIRSIFMNTFFSGIYRSGIAFGTTFPGYFYAVGGWTSLVLLSALFGATLELINQLLRLLRSPWLVFSYMFAMLYYVAVGGDLIESGRKLLNAAAPGILLWMLGSVVRRYLSRTTLVRVASKRVPASPPY